MSISKNQIKALRDGFLDKIEGGDYSVVNKDELPLLEKVLYEYGIAFNDAIQKNLEKSGSIASGKLAEPSFPVVKKFGTKYVMYLGYPTGSEQIKYYDFVNKGVKGYKSGKPNNTPYAFKNPYPNKKMAKSILTWLSESKSKVSADNVNTNRKGGISATENKRQSLKKVLSGTDKKKSLAYAISTSIKRKGIEQTKYFDKAIESVFNDKFTEELAYAMISDMAVKISGKVTKEIKGK